MQHQTYEAPAHSRETAVVPPWIMTALAILFVLLSLSGLARLGPGNYLNARALLEIAYIALPIAVMLFTPRFRLEPRVIPIILVLGFLLAFRGAIILLESQAPLAEALRAHKWVLFLLLLALLVRARLSDTRVFVATTKTVLILAAVEYALTAVTDPGQRPTLFIENNYEIALFTGLLVVAYPYMGRLRAWYPVLLAGTVFLSGSRSGIITLIIGVLYLMWTSGVLRHPLLAYAGVVAVGIVAFLALEIFESRLGRGQIDRQRFFDAFLSDTKGWDVSTWLFGTHPISQVSAETCNSLSYWAARIGLDSEGGEGSCYSVVFHAFLIRIVYDFGLVGLVMAFGVLWYVMRLANVDRRLALALLGVALANSASVSGLNNVYVMFPVAFAVLTSGIPAHPPDSRRRAHARVQTQQPGDRPLTNL